MYAEQLEPGFFQVEHNDRWWYAKRLATKARIFAEDECWLITSDLGLVVNPFSALGRRILAAVALKHKKE